MNVRQSLSFNLEPFKHQWDALEKGGNKYGFAFLMDPGTGKTKVTIDNAAWLYARGVINAMLVLGPGDVPEQWLSEQIPLHWTVKEPRMALWRSNSQRRRRECLELSSKPIANTFTVLAMNHEALATDAGEKCAKNFLLAYKTMAVLDESDFYANPKAQRTRAALRLGKHALVRRILTGTVADTPFDLFSQFEFLDPRILGCDSYFVFKHHYGVFSKEFAKYKDPKTGEMKLRPYDSLQHYQRLEELYAKIDKYSYRITKEQCTDLPPKLYSFIPTHLSDAQLKLYNQIKEKGFALIRKAEDGQKVTLEDLGLLDDEELIDALKESSNRLTASIKLVVMLRLQQCVGGFVTDDSKKVRCIDGDPEEVPRMRATIDKVREIVRAGAKVIIWAQFRAELVALYDLLLEAPISAGLVHGDITGDTRTAIFNKFKDVKSNLKVLVAHPRTAGVGMNFAVATAAIYYSDGYSYRQRKQSEDRIHRIGQTGTVNIYDLKALDVPMDESIAEIRSAKKNFSSAFMNGRVHELEKLC